MNRIINLTLLSLLLSANLITANQTPANLAIRPLSEQRITAKQNRLQKELNRHSKMRGVLYAAGGTMTVLSIGKMIREFFSATQLFSRDDVPNAVEKPLSKKISSFATGFGWFCAETGGAIAVNHILGQLLGKVMHDESLAWWLKTHAPYQQTVELMEEIAEQYAHAMTPEDAARHQVRFVRVATNLFDQFESVIAFMRYKSKSGTVTMKSLKREIESTTSDHMDAFYAQLQDSVVKNNASALAALIQDFKSQLNQALVRFAYADQ